MSFADSLDSGAGEKIVAMPPPIVHLFCAWESH
jgi:hypothetical protein